MHTKVGKFPTAGLKVMTFFYCISEYSGMSDLFRSRCSKNLLVSKKEKIMKCKTFQSFYERLTHISSTVQSRSLWWFFPLAYVAELNR